MRWNLAGVLAKPAGVISPERRRRISIGDAVMPGIKFSLRH
jgi:hypothetical protein